MKTRCTINQPSATILCGALLCSAVAAYLYFLNMSVVQVVLRTEALSEQRELHTQIASLDAQYITAQHAVAARIVALGDEYQTNAAKVFVSREQSRLVLQTR